MLKKIVSIILIVMTSLGLTACGLSSCSSEDVSNTREDLKNYYGYMEIAGKDTYIVICDGEVLGMGFMDDEELYVPYTEYRKQIDNKCYVDDNEGTFVYTTATNIYDCYVGSTKYKDIDGNETDYGCTIAWEIQDNYYISAKFLKEIGKRIDYKAVSEPNRIVINATFTNDVVTANTDTVLRVDASDRTNILSDVKKGDELVIVSEKESYKQVVDADGVKGFIKSSEVGKVTTKTIERENTPEPYIHLRKDTKVCLGWHQMMYDTGNDSLYDLIDDATALNVISPTWYSLADSNGSINSLSSASYVDKAHNEGIDVWALIDDFSYGEDGTYYVTDVLSHTTSRRKLIDNLVKDVKDKGIDGINVDFECIGIEIADDYVQFICELSVWCRIEGIVLSVDMYVPSDINQYYNRKTVLEVADYLIIMGYDEHWAGAPEAGSVASLPYVEIGIQETISEGDSTRVINALPFYTRIWRETPIEFAEDGSQIVEDSIKGSYALDSQAVGLGTADQLLIDKGVNKFWVEDLSQYYAEYEDGNDLVRIWLEEEKSIQAKIDVMNQYNLGGVACWRLGLEEDWVWSILEGYVGE